MTNAVKPDCTDRPDYGNYYNDSHVYSGAGSLSYHGGRVIQEIMLIG